ncbi:MAG: hypothetical protein ACREHD_14390, partial [Pirellulales bacterium]
MPTINTGGVNFEMPDALIMQVGSSCPTVASGSFPFNYEPNSGGPGGAGATWLGPQGMVLNFDGSAFWLEDVPCTGGNKIPVRTVPVFPFPEDPSTYFIAGQADATASAPCCGLPPDWISTGINFRFGQPPARKTAPACSCPCSC